MDSDFGTILIILVFLALIAGIVYFFYCFSEKSQEIKLTERTICSNSTKSIARR